MLFQFFAFMLFILRASEQADRMIRICPGHYSSFSLNSRIKSQFGVSPNPGRRGASIIPSFASIFPSTRSYIIELPPSENSIMVAEGEANAIFPPAIKEKADPQQ